jgi:hypothetical protein
MYWMMNNITKPIAEHPVRNRFFVPTQEILYKFADISDKSGKRPFHGACFRVEYTGGFASVF